MFHKITVNLSPEREYAAYVNGSELEIVARIDGHSARLGRARWDGRAVNSDGMHLHADVKSALEAAIVDAIRRDRTVAIRSTPEFEGGY